MIIFVSFQIREKEHVRRSALLEQRAARLEAQLFRAGRRSDARDSAHARTHARAQLRARALAGAVQQLRRQYAGAVPLAAQEKASRLVAALRAEREGAWRTRREAEVRAREAEQRAEELAIKQEGEG